MTGMNDRALTLADTGTRDTSAHGNRYSKETRAYVFQVWAYECLRNAADTSRYVYQDRGLEIPPETIRRWARDGAWAEVAATALREIAPDLHAATDDALIRARPMTVARMVDIVAAIDPAKPSMPQVHVLELLYNATKDAVIPAPTGEIDTDGKSGAELARALYDRIMRDRDGDE